MGYVVVFLVIMNLILLVTVSDYRQKLDGTIDEKGKKKAVKRRQYNNETPVGEQVLIRMIENLLKKKAFEEYVFYHQVDFWTEKGYQADFIVVSPKGVFVLESKFWKGTTFFYDEKHAPFQNSAFEEYGKGKYWTVLNANFSTGDTKKMILNEYRHPIEQVQGYGAILQQKLLLSCIENAVIFHETNAENVRWNDKPIQLMHRIDDNTFIILDQYLETFLRHEQKIGKRYDHKKVMRLIERSDDYAYKRKYTAKKRERK